MNEQGIIKVIGCGVIVTIICSPIHIFQDEIKRCMGWQAGFCPLTNEITYDGGSRYKGDILKIENSN